MIASALYSHQGLAADLASQCMLGVPSYDRPLVQGETNELPVTINADNAKGNYPDDAVFTGNVDIAQGNSRLQADEVQLHQKQAEGQPGAHLVGILCGGDMAIKQINKQLFQGDFQRFVRRRNGCFFAAKQHEFFLPGRIKTLQIQIKLRPICPATGGKLQCFHFA